MVFFEITYLKVSYRYSIINSQTKKKKSQKNSKYVIACQCLLMKIAQKNSPDGFQLQFAD